MASEPTMQVTSVTVTNDAEKPLWFKRSRWEWALRATGGGSKRTLMLRCVDENGLGSDGRPVAWRDIATFDSYNDADMVLRLLQAGASPSLEERER